MEKEIIGMQVTTIGELRKLLKEYKDDTFFLYPVYVSKYDGQIIIE